LKTKHALFFATEVVFGEEKRLKPAK